MRLLELVRGTDTTDDVIDRLADFNDRVLGKGVVRCADTPGFLGNRVGVFALQVGIDEAIRCGLTIEDADALMGTSELVRMLLPPPLPRCLPAAAMPWPLHVQPSGEPAYSRLCRSSCRRWAMRSDAAAAGIAPAIWGRS